MAIDLHRVDEDSSREKEPYDENHRFEEEENAEGEFL